MRQIRWTWDQAYWLAGSASHEQLSAAQDVGDFNGDGGDDLLITGSQYSYLILGPTTIADQGFAKDHATAVFDISKLGLPAERMSDLDGDGKTELIFVKSESSPGAIPPIPPTYSFRVVHSEWLENKDDVQSRLIDELAPTLVIQGAAGELHAEISVHGLDFDGDDFQDLLVTGARENINSNIVGWIVLGKTLQNVATPLTWTITELSSIALVEILEDATDVNAVATEALAGVAIAPLASPGIDYTATVAGDINGDGLEDIVLANSLFVDIRVSGMKLPPYGRVYVLYGTPTGTSPLSVNLDEHVVYQDFDLGAGLASLGDLNRDGYDDLAIIRGEETAQYASLEVFYGSDALTLRKGNLLSPLAGDISLRRTGADNVPTGLCLSGLLDVTAGDFDGDRHMDLAVGETERTVMNATGQVLDHDARGHLYVYWSVEDRGSELRLADADVVVDGEAAFDQFGRLPSAPGLDLNGDHYADLIVGASMSHVVGTPTLSNAGKMYLLPGGPRQFALPPLSSMPVLSNNPFTGSGDFADGTRGTILDQVPLDSDTGKGWFQFTTLGDGVGGTYVRVGPDFEESRSLFVNPIDALAVSPASIDYTSPTFALSGSNQAELIMELDLAGLLPNIAELGTDDDRLASLTLQLDYFNLHVQQGVPYDLQAPFSTAPIAFDQRLVFAAKRSSSSQQSVWSADAQSAQLVASYAQGLVEQLTAAGNSLYFTVDDTVHGRELYRSDGTAAGTRLVKEVVPGSQGSNPMQLTAAGDDLYFVVRRPLEQPQLFRAATAGDPEAIGEPGEYFLFERLFAVGSRLYFVTRQQSSLTRTLWTVGPGESHAQLLRTFVADAVENLTAVGDTLYFTTRWQSAQAEGEMAAEGEDPSEGYDLWCHVPGNAVKHLAHSDYVSELTDFEGTLYFVEASWLGYRLGRVVEEQIEWITDRFDPILQLAAVDTTLYFSVWDAASNSTHLYQYSGVEPVRMPSMAEDPDSLLSALDRLFIITWSASNQPSLWVWQASQNQAVRLTSASTDGQLTAFTEVDGRLFFARGDQSGSLEWWVTDGTPQGTLPALTTEASTVAIEVDLLNAEGDGAVNRTDVEADEEAVAAWLHFSPTLSDTSGIASLDMTGALKDLLAQGKTRATLRVSLSDPDASMSVRRTLTDPAARTGLVVDIDRQDGFLLDLFDATGGRIAEGRPVVSLQTLEAGTYIGRVYRPIAASDPAEATIEIVAPPRGVFHPQHTRDLLLGEDGDDILVGGSDLDRLFGHSGYDTFVASPLEAFDRLVCCQSGSGDPRCVEPLITPEPAEGLTTVLDPPLDLTLEVPDPVLLRAFAEQLGIPVTVSHDGRPLLHEPLWASELGTLTRLDLPRAGVADLSGSQYATNCAL